MVQQLELHLPVSRKRSGSSALQKTSVILSEVEGSLESPLPEPVQVQDIGNRSGSGHR
jgi:hypothetical protein